jgi:hypothetical protein
VLDRAKRGKERGKEMHLNAFEFNFEFKYKWNYKQENNAMQHEVHKTYISLYFFL